MKKYVILDIDRTIINGTSWYHACSCPNLLIDEYNIDRFKELNNKMYVHGTSKDRYEFRKQTFELINKRVSESAYRKLSECGCADEILIGQNVNEVFFEAVGIYTYKKLMKSDEDCKKIVDFIYKYYFGDIEFIFLTSGYEPFMKGLVKEYMKSFHKNCTWRTIGSTIKFSNGCIYLKEVMTQEKKFQFVKKIIDYGNRVVFLADDSVEEKELFSVVFRNGGYAFNVRYDEKLHESNWHELINDIEDENVFLSYLMKNSEVALSDCKKVQNNFFRLHMNEIGVICLNDIEYQIFLGSFNRDKKIVEYIKKVSHKKEEKYYLRGRYYYYWLPSYITGSLESKYAGWKKIVIDGIDIIEHIARYNIKENKYACILSYVICDHLLSVLYLAMYCAEEDVLDRERNVISSYRHIENSVCIDKNVYEMGTMVYKGRYRITGLNPYTNLAFLCCHFYREATDTIWTEGKRDVTLYKIVDMMNFIRFYREQINYDIMIEVLKKLNIEKKAYFTFKIMTEFYEYEFLSEMLSRLDEYKSGDDEMKAIHDTKNKTTIYRDETFFEKTFARG